MTIKPVVGIITNETSGFNGRQLSHSAGKRYVESVIKFSGVVPILIPSGIRKNDLDCLLKFIDGIVLTGGRANVEPHHYNGPKFPEDEPIDPDRDQTALDLISECVKREMPIFGICRGIQEMNVAFGGTLFYRVHLEKGMKDHRMPTDPEATLDEIFQPKHKINFTKDSLLRNLSGSEMAIVNSLHGQGIKRLGEGLEIEAISDDQLIEAVSISNYTTFGVGVQWHAEFEPERSENELNRKLFQKFGEACQNSLKRK
jgi:putative glutamine amidotransferase